MYEKQTQNKAGLIAAGGGIALTNLGAALPAFAADAAAPPETAQTATLDPDALNSGDRTVTVIPKSVRRRLPPHR